MSKQTESAHYRVKFEIDVWGTVGPEAACKRAWLLMTHPDAWLPVGEVARIGGKIGVGDETTLIDLQDLKDKGAYDKL